MKNVFDCFMADKDVQSECDVGGQTGGSKHPHRNEEGIDKTKSRR